jgi:hypothetical protein
MKKTLIMGATSLVLAATPVFGVFAATGDPSAVTDNLKVTVTEICTFTRSSGNGSYSKSMLANALDDNFANTTLKAVCNADDGYKVVGTYTALAGTPGGSIPFGTTKPAAGTSSWAVLKGTTGSTYLTNNGNIISKSGADTSAGTSQAVRYQVATADNIAQGTYTGTATYTLTQN